MSGDDKFAEWLKETAAFSQQLCGDEVELAERLEHAGAPEVLVETMRQSARFMEHLGSVQAAQSLAYETMMAAGGPDNSRAYVEYEAATLRNTALLPQEPLPPMPLIPPMPPLD